MPTLTGTTLGKYQILERLGRGGMADVYRARHTRLDRDVAIKVLHPHLIEGQDFLARFEREAKSVASLKHPHIVQVFDFDSQDDLHYIVMELVGGGSLHGRLDELARRGTRMPQEEALRILTDVASAIDYAHGRGMLHRDIKPANILLDHDGDAFLSDFGIARILSETHFTTTGALIGTPQYMSPEQGKGLPLAKATDLYSLGVVLYEMLTGRAPYDSDTPMGVIHKHIYDPLPSPRLACPDLPLAVEAVLLKSLAKEPDDRFPSAGQMLRALKDGLAAASQEVVAPAIHTPEPERPAPQASASGTSPASLPTALPPVSAPVGPTISGQPTVAMEEQSPGAQPPSGVPSPPAQVGLPGKRPRPAARVGRILVGVALVAVIGVALAFGLPRLLTAATTGPTARPAPTRTSGPGQCLALADCMAEASSALAAGRYAEAVASYARAQYLVPQDQHPAYAQLWCDMARARVALAQKQQALVNFERCIDWTEEEAGGTALRSEAQRQIAVLSGGSFAEGVVDFRLGADANPACVDPATALGPPDFDATRTSTFLCLGTRGFVTLEFVNNIVVDGPGPDIKIHGDPQNNDTWHVDVSQNGTNWVHFGPQDEVVELDLATIGLPTTRFIRLTDTGGGSPGPFVGAELDAVEALNSEPAG